MRTEFTHEHDYYGCLPEGFVGSLSGRHRQQKRLLKFEVVNRIKTIF